MSDQVTLRLRTPVEGRLDAESIRADRCAGLSEREIAGLPVWLGRQQARLGDFFDVRGGRSSRVSVEGVSSNVDGLGAGMSAGELTVAGDAGDRVAAGLTGGLVDVRGSVGADAGAGMSGGTLRVGGSAGDRLGASHAGASRGMTGGEIVVRGSAGAEAAARCRRGLVAVLGAVGPHAARSMIAGTLIVFGEVGHHPARGNRRGSLVAAGAVEVPATYTYASTFDPPHVRLMMVHLHKRHGVALGLELLGSRYRRYCGDIGVPARGEILVRVVA